MPDRSDERHTLLRATQDTHRTAIYPGDAKILMRVNYHVDNEVLEPNGLASEAVTATAYVHGELAATEERRVRDLHRF